MVKARQSKNARQAGAEAQAGIGGRSRRRRWQDRSATVNAQLIPLAERIEQLPITEVHPYENNPRVNDQAVESVRNSIRTYGFLVPILVDEENVIVAGHTRLLAAEQLEMEMVPCIRATHLTDEQISQFRIIDNKVAELAKWDFDALSSELGALAESGLDWTQFGFQQEELDCLTEVVADDCLSTGAAAELQESERSRRATRQASSQTRVVIGEFVFFIPAELYRQWAAALRNECDYETDAIDGALKDRLGMSEYLE